MQISVAGAVSGGVLPPETVATLGSVRGRGHAKRDVSGGSSPSGSGGNNRRRDSNFPDEPFERRHLVAVHQGLEFRREDRVVHEVLRRHVQGDVRLDRDQLLGQPDMVLRRAELLLLPRRQFIQMRIDPLHGTVPAQQLRGAHGAHALHAGDIVRGVAADGQDVHHLGRRGDLPFLTDLRGSQQLVLSPALARAQLEDAGADQLAVILVRRDHVDLEPLAGEAPGRGTDHVVGLEAGNHQHRDIQRLYDLRQGLQRLDHQRGRLAAVGLVGRIHLVAEGAARRVETDRDVGGMLPVDEFEQVFRESEQDGGVHPLGIDHRTPEEGVVHLEDERVAVDQKKFHTAKMKLFPKVSKIPAENQASALRTAAAQAALASFIRRSEAWREKRFSAFQRPRRSSTDSQTPTPRPAI